MKTLVLVSLLVGLLAGCDRQASQPSTGPEGGATNPAGQAGPPVDAVSGASVAPAETGGKITVESAGMQLELDELIRTDGVVWSMDFIDLETMIFTERSGKVTLLRLDNAEQTPVAGGPEVMQAETGGVFGVHVDPDFASNRLLYFVYVKAVSRGSVIALARAKLENNKLTELTDIFVANNASDDHAHWGSRVVMSKDRHLFMAVGDRHVPNNAQSLMSHGGKVLRLNEDGSAAAGNPFAGRDDALPEIWSIGHRNPQGLRFHPVTGELFEQEHGPTGGDEINILAAGNNYGWPVITWGENIWGGQLPEGTERAGMEQPLKYFLPGIAPSGMAIYAGEKYPGWQGNIFSSTLRGHLNRLVLDGRKVVEEEHLLQAWGERLRDVVVGPDALIYVSTEGGAIARLMPAP